MKIFLSYSRRDSGDFAHHIYETLKDEYNVFTDIKNIQVGDIWSNVIEENIAACDIFIMIVTFAALRSPEVEKEVLLAKRMNKKIIPCFYRDINMNEIRWDLEKFQGIQFADKYELARDIWSKIHEYQPGRGPTPGTREEPREEPSEKPSEKPRLIRRRHRKLIIGFIIVIIIASFLAFGWLNHMNTPTGLNERGDTLYEEGEYA